MPSFGLHFEVRAGSRRVVCASPRFENESLGTMYSQLPGASRRTVRDNTFAYGRHKLCWEPRWELRWELRWDLVPFNCFFTAGHQLEQLDFQQLF